MGKSLAGGLIRQRHPRFMAIACLLLSTMFGRAAIAASGRSMDDYFRGKTIRLILPTAPGGGRGLYALPFAQFYGKYVPGHPTIQPVFMPGAGGSAAADYLYNVAAPDGLTILSPIKALVTAQAIGDPSVKYDVSKMNWIGRITDATQIFYASTKVKAANFLSFRDQSIVVSTTDYSSPTFQLASFANHVLGTKFKIITGYQTAAAMNMAVLNGESQGAFTTWNDLGSYHRDWIRDKKVRLLLQIGLVKNPAFGDLPLMTDLAPNKEARDLSAFISSSSDFGESFVAPPGLAPDVLATLRKAFDETMKDPELIATFQRLKVQFDPLNGEGLTKIVDDTIGASPAIVAKYKAAVSVR